ncbi:hypothetical protein [Zhongshania sp.]|uniref:hypothetical protein n=1 Tax=Zhongshania sp. TaxID=1971902 RepID=UPI003568BBA7
MNSDLSADLSSPADLTHMKMWFRVMKADGLNKQGIEKMHAAYCNDVAVLPEEDVTCILESGRFVVPTVFFQPGLIRAVYSKKAYCLAPPAAEKP